MTNAQYIEEQLIEWKGKTISSPDHFQEQLKRTLFNVADFVHKNTRDNMIIKVCKRGKDIPDINIERDGYLG